MTAGRPRHRWRSRFRPVACLGVLVLLATGCGGAADGSTPGARRAGGADSASASGERQAASERPSDLATVASPAPSHVDPERPRRLVLPQGTVVPVYVASTAASGLLNLPEDVHRAGWWDGSAMLGDVLGSVVIAAHVDSFDQGLGAFAELLSARPGQQLELASAGLQQTYRISVARLLPKASVDAESPLYSGRAGRTLVLITCGGPYDSTRGGYQDNFVVVADPVGPLGHEIS